MNWTISVRQYQEASHIKAGHPCSIVSISLQSDLLCCWVCILQSLAFDQSSHVITKCLSLIFLIPSKREIATKPLKPNPLTLTASCILFVGSASPVYLNYFATSSACRSLMIGKEKNKKSSQTKLYNSLGIFCVWIASECSSLLFTIPFYPKLNSLTEWLNSDLVIHGKKTTLSVPKNLRPKTVSSHISKPFTLGVSKLCYVRVLFRYAGALPMLPRYLRDPSPRWLQTHLNNPGLV